MCGRAELLLHATDVKPHRKERKRKHTDTCVERENNSTTETPNDDTSLEWREKERGGGPTGVCVPSTRRLEINPYGKMRRIRYKDRGNKGDLQEKTKKKKKGTEKDNCSGGLSFRGSVCPRRRRSSASSESYMLLYLNVWHLPTSPTHFVWTECGISHR